jgi:divalent metal cation (Fe/Co/Zn/Cd) transporter
MRTIVRNHRFLPAFAGWGKVPSVSPLLTVAFGTAEPPWESKVYEIIKEGIAKLLGEEPGQELIDKINAAVKTVYAGDARPHRFHMHNYVVHKELALHIRLDKDLTIETGHRIATDIETIIQEQFGIIATVHTEPLYPENRV